MNPEGHPGEFVPLQGGRYDGYQVQPGPPMMVQYTSVNISTEPPKDHIIWSLCCFFYSNPFCLGLAALIFSIKARDQKVAGDLEGARHYGATARCLNIVSTVLISTVILTSIIIVSVVTARANEINSSFNSHNHKYYNSYNYRG